jgi:hypothetical protein
MRSWQGVDEEMVGRGVYGGGPWLVARNRVHQRYLDMLEDHQRQTFRESEEALMELGPIENLVVRFQLRKKKFDEPSIERRIFSGDKSAE